MKEIKDLLNSKNIEVDVSAWFDKVKRLKVHELLDKKFDTLYIDVHALAYTSISLYNVLIEVIKEYQKLKQEG